MNKISALSANSLLAKARAMYGEILTNSNYDEMVNCRTINELASYLKNHTAYGSAFVDLTNVKINRARLEAVLKKHMLSRIASICSFEKAIGQSLFKSLLIKNDIECILTCANYLDSDNIGEYMIFIPEFFKTHSSLDTVALERSHSFDELYLALKGTIYQPLLDVFTNEANDFSVQLLESILYNYYYTQSAKIINENYKGEKKEALLDIYRMASDYKTIESIFRLKKYFAHDSINKSKFFFSDVTSFSQKNIDSFLEASSTDEFLELIKETRYGKYISTQSDEHIERKTLQAALKINEKQLRFSTCPEVVVLSYIGILENELGNITNIIEGIRYSLPPEEIMKFLVKKEENL
ncbi:MAG: V-type ATPase subunit [Oscillospiraceae bacterium]